MSRLRALFERKPKNVLSVYFTAGYPGLEDTVPLALWLEEGGADLVEIGMPYSDPLADGPTIQASSTAALKNGMTLPLLFEQIRQLRPQTHLPLVLMGYFNQVMQFGEERFVQTCADCGIDGVILPDLPLDEYERHYQPLFEAARLPISFLITPQTPEGRVRKVEALSTAFIYMVSNAAITGARDSLSPRQIAYFERIEAMNLQRPRLIGFGISNRKTFQTACRYANGAIIGSAFIKALKPQPELKESVLSFLRVIDDRPSSLVDRPPIPEP